MAFPRRPGETVDEYLARTKRQGNESVEQFLTRQSLAPTITTTAQPGGPIARGIARAQLGMGKTTPGMYAFGEEREQLTPQQRGSLERARAGRAIAEDIGKGIGGQPSRTLARVKAGAATLAGMERAPALREEVRKIEEATAPQTATGAGVRALSEIAPYALTGMLGLGAGAATSAALTGLESAAGPEQSTVNMLLRATGRKEIQSPVARALADVAIDLTPAALLSRGGRGAARASEQVQVPRRAVERAAPPVRIRGLLPAPREVPSGPAIPMGGIPETGPRRITEPSRLLPAQAAERSPFVDARLEGIIPSDLAVRREAARTLERQAQQAPEQMARLREADSLDEMLGTYPDGTPRVTPQDVSADLYKRSPKAPKNLSDRELDLEFQQATALLDESRGALGDWAVADSKMIEAGYATNADDVFGLGAAPKKKGGRPERMTIGERYWEGRNLSDDTIGAIEAAGYEPRQFLELRNRVVDARKRLPSLEKRITALQAEHSKRGLQSLPREAPPVRGAEAPGEVLRELDVLGEQAAQRGDARLGAAIAPNVASMAAGGALGAAPAEDEDEADAGQRIGRGLVGAAAAAGGYQAYRALRGRMPQVGEALSQIGRRAEDVPSPVLAEGPPTGVARSVTEERMARGAERVQKPSRPYPSNATYVPRTDDEWREFYGRFMTNPDEIAEVDALRQAGVVQGQQGTRPIAKDTRMAETIAETLGDLAVRDAGRKLSGPELLALRAQREANAARRVALAERLGDPNLSPVDREWMVSLRDQLEDVMIAQFERYTRDVSQTGRDLRLLQESVKLSDNPADWVLRAERVAGGKKMTPAQELELITAVRNKELAKASGIIGKLRETGILDQAGELWQTGLLTSVMRPVRDVFSNVLNLADKQAERAAATFVDAALGTMTGIRTADYSIAGSLKPLQEGLYRGGQAAMAILRGGGSPEAIARAARRYDFERETLQTVPALRAYTTFVRRTIGAADALVFDAAVSSALGEQARVVARAKGLKPNTPQFAEAVTKYLEAPPPEMLGVALAQANEVTWQNSTFLGELAAPLRQSKNEWMRLFGKVAVPFVQTPSAMTTQTLKGTFGLPGAVAATPKFIGAVLKKADIPDAQRTLVNRVAKGSVGAGWIYAGWVLADNDKMTSAYPSDDRERRRWELEGRTESAVKVGGTWVSMLGILGPQAQLMAVGAALRKMIDEDPEFITQSTAGKLAQGAMIGVAGAGRAALESPMLQGVQSVADFATQLKTGDRDAISEAGAKVAQSYVGGVVPQVMQQIARASDVTPEGQVRMRQVRVEGDPMRTAVNAFMQGLPGARQQLPVRRTALGGERATSVGGLAGVFSPARLSRETQDPVAQELWRTGAAVPRTPQRRGERAGTFDERQQALGSAVTQAVQAAMQDPEYQGIARMDVAELRQALGNMMQEEGQSLPELERLQSMSDEDIRRRYQGIVLDRVIQRARTSAGAAYPNPRGGRAGALLRSLTRP
jgi:hypothetical protein